MLTRWLAALCLLSAGLAGAAAEEFRTPSISAVRVEWRAVLDQFRTEIDTRPAIASRFTLRRPAARAGFGSALDARAGATERDQRKPLRRDRTQPGAGAVAVRYRRLPRRPRRRHDRCRCRAIRPISVPQTCFTPVRPATTRCFRCDPGAGLAVADLRQAGRGADHRLDPRLRPRRSARRQGRAGQGAGGAVPRHAPLHPRRLCALRLHALRRAVCGVDPVPGFDAAGAAAGLPRGLSRSPSAF